MTLQMIQDKYLGKRLNLYLIDGEEVEIYETMDALIAFDVESAGEHEMVLKYRPKTFVYGMILTVSCSLLFLGICLLTFVMKKKENT